MEMSSDVMRNASTRYLVEFTHVKAMAYLRAIDGMDESEILPLTPSWAVIKLAGSRELENASGLTGL
jgi:hypothetical protein